MESASSSGGKKLDAHGPVNATTINDDDFIQVHRDLASGVLDSMILAQPDPYINNFMTQGNEDSPYLGLDNINSVLELPDLQPRPLPETAQCEINDFRLLAKERQKSWPTPSAEFTGHSGEEYYSAAQVFGTSNETSARVDDKTSLDVGKWNSIATGHPDDHIVLSGIRHGFSLQYTGPALEELSIEMHASGEKFLTFAHISRKRLVTRPWLAPSNNPCLKVGATQARS